ncbi:MAG: RNA polymerase sigma factor [Bacteroidota bacterium]|nr:RNA polymerase sigma factor [Bacteroidota bacterium]MDP4233419.1 RNA polymerase sigma factor [Bacteroidota bacterium]MDP4242285.1 RNA polymerase sigma factor [Bacteroidota bacterium]MDP4287041.1 RNA polymerase sigma factor [Bacteroidota bacterium]
MTAELTLSDIKGLGKAEGSKRLEAARQSLVRFVSSRVRDLETAEDIVQDVFLSLLRSSNAVGSPDMIIEDAGAWLARAARNRIIDWYRKHKTERITPEIERTARSTSNALSDLAASDAYEAFIDALAEMPAKQREIFVMNEMEGVSFREISEATGENLNTLLARKHRAVQFLRKRLAKYQLEFDEG